LLRNGAYNLAGAVLRALLNLVSIPLLIRYLGNEMYGLWVLIVAILGVAMVADGGLSTSMTYFGAKDLAGDDSVGLGHTVAAALLSTLVLAVLMGVVVELAAPLIMSFFDNLPIAQQRAGTIAIRLGAVSLVALLMQNVLSGLFHAMQLYGTSNLLSTVQLAINTIGYIAIAAAGGSVTSLMAWQVCVSVVALAVYALVARSLLRRRAASLRISTEKIRAVSKYGAHTWVGSLGSVAFSQLDRIIVGKSLGTSVLAVYGAITGVVKQINTFTAVPVQPLLPQLAQLSMDGSMAGEIRTAVRRALHINTLGALALGLGLFTLAPVVLPVLLDRSATPLEITALRVGAIIYGLFSLNGVGYYVLLAMHRLRSFMFIQLLSGVLAIALIAIGCRYGLVGAITGNVGYLGVSALSLLGMRYVDVTFMTWTGWIRPALLWAAATTMVALVVPQHPAVLVIAATIQCAVLAVWFAREQPGVLHSLKQAWQHR
jgi:O-antigen/teichoic acid export membrane protein